jgi:large subunit ribosomal protein L15
MELHTLTPAPGAIKKKKRIGRGQGSGKGGTATKGHNGAQSRSGYKTKRGFEGGQMPLQRRIPKFGFTNPNRIVYKPINLDTLAALAKKADTTTIDAAMIQAHSLVNKKGRYKILAGGTLTAPLTVAAHAFSKSAQEAIEKAKGKAIKI